MRARATAIRWATVACLGASACAADLPDPQLVIEDRILAVRAWVVDGFASETPESGLDRAEALPLETLQLDPLWVGPQGVHAPDELDPVWIACELGPGTPPFACISEHFPLRLENIPACPEQDPETALEEGPQAIPSPCLLPRQPQPRYVVPLSEGIMTGSDIELTVVAGSPGGTTTETCVTALLAGEHDTPNDCLFGVQIVPVGPKPRLLELARELGLDVGDIELPPADEADTHPRITSFRVVELDGRGEPIGPAREVERGEVVEVTRGRTLRIDTSSPAEDLQEYGIVINGGDQGAKTRSEAYTGLWFRTWGEQLATSSLAPDSYNEWTLAPAEDDADDPPGDLAHLYYVVRDGRQGVAWWWFSVRLR